MEEGTRAYQGPMPVHRFSGILQAMTPPIWLDEHGQGVPTRPCAKCGKDEPVRRLRFDHLRMIGWKLLGTVQIVNWCEHGQDYVPWPEGDGYRRLVPIAGEAA